MALQVEGGGRIMFLEVELTSLADGDSLVIDRRQQR